MIVTGIAATLITYNLLKSRLLSVCKLDAVVAVLFLPRLSISLTKYIPTMTILSLSYVQGAHDYIVQWSRSYGPRAIWLLFLAD